MTLRITEFLDFVHCPVFYKTLKNATFQKLDVSETLRSLVSFRIPKDGEVRKPNNPNYDKSGASPKVPFSCLTPSMALNKTLLQAAAIFSSKLIWSKTNQSAAIAGRVPFVLFPADPDTEAYLGVTVITTNNVFPVSVTICIVSIDIWSSDHEAWFPDWFRHPVPLFRSAHWYKVTVI
jgi:hypothetical protein